MKRQKSIKQLGKKELQQLINDPLATARAVKLKYVTCNEAGIHRIRSGKGFHYVYKGKPVKDKSVLQRIRSLVLPPAWQHVWICVDANGHLQATGVDVKGRKQYRYHHHWNELRNTTKFFRLPQLGKQLPEIRKQLDKHLLLPGLSKNKVLATVVKLMEMTGIRIGNEFYEKLYGSFGITTLKDKHASIHGSILKLSFKGKKGVEHNITLKSKKLANIVRHCRDIPGKELFQYIDEQGKRQVIDSGMVNDYIRELANDDFTAKDFRTWCGTVAALQAIEETGVPKTEKHIRKSVITILDKVAAQLGNTRTVCKKYYVHPSLLEMYEAGKLDRWVGKKITSKNNGLLVIEKKLLKILEQLN